MLLIFDQQWQWKKFIGIVSIRSPDAVLPLWGLDRYWTRYTFLTTVSKWKHVRFDSRFLAFLNHKKEMVSQWMKHHSDGVIRSTLKFASQWRLSFKFFVIDFFLSNAGTLHHKLAELLNFYVNQLRVSSLGPKSIFITKNKDSLPPKKKEKHWSASIGQNLLKSRLILMLQCKSLARDTILSVWMFCLRR